MRNAAPYFEERQHAAYFGLDMRDQRAEFRHFVQAVPGLPGATWHPAHRFHQSIAVFSQRAPAPMCHSDQGRAIITAHDNIVCHVRLTMLARARHRLGSWIGLLAILMATLAPTISHLLAANRLPDVLCSVRAANDDGGSGHESPQHSITGLSDDCGYCNLLAHIPVVPAIEAPFVAIAWAIEHRKATRIKSVRRLEPLTASQPRAPPVLS
jgi:hypothetical protein